MEARNRKLTEWFANIRAGSLALPRFQRAEAWGPNEVSGLMTTVLRGLPSGAALILEVGDREKFPSRLLESAPATGNRVTEHLLDGQQRLTALWKSLNAQYDTHTYFVEFAESEAGEPQPSVFAQSRWMRNGQKYPLWADQPAECWQRGYIPLHILSPEFPEHDLLQWIFAALPDEGKTPETLMAASSRINGLRSMVREFNLPFLSLPATTPAYVALDVFVKMNTSAVRLSSFDIVVALVEGATGSSLHEHIEEIIRACPQVECYAEPASLALDAATLSQDKAPTQANYSQLDYQQMIDGWPDMVRSIKGLVEFLEEECVFDAKRLPSYPPLPVIAALWPHLPKQVDQLGRARQVLRRYLWCSFLTDRYEHASTNAALQDYRALKAVLQGTGAVEDIPALKAPKRDIEELLTAGWPASKNTLARALLALQLKCGAEDFADGKRATAPSIRSTEHAREYHHLFPASLLREAGVPENRINQAVNCALITWGTNRTVSNKDPIAYLKDRIDLGSLSEAQLRQRVQSHLIPFDLLNVGYNGLDTEARYAKLRADFETFCQQRATMLAAAAQQACLGETINTKNASQAA